MVYNIVKKDLTEEKQKSGLILLVFHATWCGPCKMLDPVLEETSEKLGINVYKVDVDQDRDFAREMQVKGTPTTFIFKDGEAIDKIVGYVSTSKMIEKLKPYK